MSEIAGYLVVFDRRETAQTDLDSIEPWEPDPARFRTREEAERRKTTYESWDRKSDWSIFTDSICSFVMHGGRTKLNPEYDSAPFEVRIVSISWLNRPTSFLTLKAEA